VVGTRYLFRNRFKHDFGSRLQEFLKSQGPSSIGRLGSWQYSSIDDATVEGLKTAREVSQPWPEPPCHNVQPDRPWDRRTILPRL
jgi:hypothetical protein